LQCIFLSPERLAISSFRERLKNMHEYNVYFSYGVIDEVHCVSEWGHDFRFSYLHLGRNLYNYVRSKQKEISLFGLTATASFDVLADVDRELSGMEPLNLMQM
jgi:superfamily II DNA helicase RecQ